MRKYHVLIALGIFVFTYSVSSRCIAGIDSSGHLSIRQISNTGVDISPLQTTGLVNIRFNQSQTPQSVKIIVFDMLGNIIPKTNTVFFNENMMQVNLSSSQPGYYFIRVQTSNAIVTKRISLVTGKIALHV